MDYYQILGIGEKATEQDIKNAFRNLALSYHPDRVPEKNRKWAHEKFREISEAYATLIDKEKRTTYNRNHQKIFLTKQQREEMLDMLRKIQEAFKLSSPKRFLSIVVDFLYISIAFLKFSCSSYIVARLL